MPKIQNGWRCGGLLAHPSSLATNYGIGDLGPAAIKFVKFIKQANLHCWQILPMTPTSTAFGNSPYSSFSAFAGNTLLISPELLYNDGLITKDELKSIEITASSIVDYQLVYENKMSLLKNLFKRVEKKLLDNEQFQLFLQDNASWVNDYALFMAAKKYFKNKPWVQWPDELKKRENQALTQYGLQLANDILYEKFTQFLFYQHLAQLKKVMAQENIVFIGDAALYVNHDSADVWANQHLFKLDKDGNSQVVAGVPPDYYAKDGQLWGNPIFDWNAHKNENFAWWKSRLAHNLGLYDWLRLDHFRGFAHYWEINAKAKTAKEGLWQKGPGEELFYCAAQGMSLNIIAEDLGYITPDVIELRKKFNFPGMAVPQFSFGDGQGSSIHSPFRIEADNVAYSSTHDNNTAKGWYRKECDALMKKQLNEICGYNVNQNNVAWSMVRLTWLSAAAIAIASLQDILNLDEKSRMNLPGTATNNWCWKIIDFEGLDADLAEKIQVLNEISGRDNKTHPNLATY